MRFPWDSKEYDEFFWLHLDMSGLGKEVVKINIEDNVLVINDEGELGELKCNTRVDSLGMCLMLMQLMQKKNGSLNIIVRKKK